MREHDLAVKDPRKITLKQRIDQLWEMKGLLVLILGLVAAWHLAVIFTDLGKFLLKPVLATTQLQEGHTQLTEQVRLLREELRRMNRENELNRERQVREILRALAEERAAEIKTKPSEVK